MTAACANPPPKVGEAGAIEGFLGAVISEEPRAALVARDVLSAGGSAADAAAAAYFAMSVTYPVAVGLGGGGVCLYYDRRANKTETLDFRVKAAVGGGAMGVPGAVRGIALLHSRYGRLPWAQLVAPAETMARFGHQISRALAKRLAPEAGRLAQNIDAARIFLHGDGTPLGEAETVVQVELASVLTRIRTRGVSDLYGGEAGRQLIQAGADHGGKANIVDLRKYRAVWRETAKRKIGNHILHHPVLNSGENKGTKLTALLATSSPSPSVAVAEVFGSAALAGPADRGEAAIVIGDSFGSSAACVFAMNGAFGSGLMASGLGVFLAPSVSADDTGANGATDGHLLPLLGVNDPLNQTVLAAAGSGGPAGAVAAVSLALAVMDNGATLAQAVAATGRLGAVGNGQLRAPVQALWCPSGLRITPKSCRFATDPKGFGLAAFDKF